VRFQALVLLGALIGGVAAWALVAWVVALAMARLANSADPDAPPFLPRETWTVVTACGAVAGALIAFSSAAPAMWFERSPGQFLELSLVTGGGMVVGAALSGLVTLLVVWLRMER
jgi:hypothetical protein